jgi:hypothetical protein
MAAIGKLSFPICRNLTFFANWCGTIVIVIAWSWIYNFLCNQCLSHLTLWVRMLLMRDVLDTTLSDNDCQWIAAGQNLTILSETTNLIFKTTVWYRKQLPFCDDLSGLFIGDLGRCWLSCVDPWFYCSQSYLAFQSFDLERTWLFQKRVVPTKFDISTFLL